MTHEISVQRMAALAEFEGKISIEGEGCDTEIVVRIPMAPEAAEMLYYELGTIAETKPQMVLNPDMTLSEVADIIESAESDVWTEHVEPIGNWHDKKARPDKRTLRDVSPRQGFVMFVERGSNEGIYLTIEGIEEDGYRYTTFVCKTLSDPADDDWFKCWASAGRIARAFDEMMW